MAAYSVHVANIQTGATAGTFASLLGLKFANTAGHRGRLRKLIVGGGSGAPQDLQVGIRVRRTDNTTDGTSTSVNVNTIGTNDSNAIGSNVSAIGKTYTVEPTTFENGTLGGGSFNTRGALLLEWGPQEAKVWGKNETLVIEGTIGNGTTAANLDITIEWEESV